MSIKLFPKVDPGRPHRAGGSGGAGHRFTEMLRPEPVGVRYALEYIYIF
jgi:hypothetical protein